MSRKKIKPAAAWISAGICFALSLFLTASLQKTDFSSAADSSDQNQTGSAVETVQSFLTQVESGDYTGLFEAAQHIHSSMDSEAAYDAALKNKFEDADFSTITIQNAGSDSGRMIYVLQSGDTSYGQVEVYEDGDTMKAGYPLIGSETYTVEVPSGTVLYSNGTQVDSSLLKESGVTPANFENVSGSFIPQADVYELSGLLGFPALSLESGQELTVMQDPITGHLLAGMPADDSLNDYILDAAERLAAYPAQDGSVSSVSEVSDTSQLWYQRYITLQNLWFTEHETSSFSDGQVLGVMKQSDDTMTAQVIFSYYAKNSSRVLERTWYIGYQLTFADEDGTWRICSTAINNELNPGNDPNPIEH